MNDATLTPEHEEQYINMAEICDQIGIPRPTRDEWLKLNNMINTPKPKLKLEDEGREMSVTELLADAISNIEGLKKANAKLNMENLQLQDNYAKAFNAGIAEGKAQIQDAMCSVEELDVDIGDEVIDVLTGFIGIITRVTEYSDGSFQCYVERTIKKALHGAWFELDRLKEV